MLRFNIDQSGLTAVKAEGKISPSGQMSMVEAEARWTRDKSDTPRAMGRDEGRSFFGSAIDFGWDELPMPMKLFRPVGIVVDVVSVIERIQSASSDRPLPLCGNSRSPTMVP